MRRKGERCQMSLEKVSFRVVVFFCLCNSDSYPQPYNYDRKKEKEQVMRFHIVTSLIHFYYIIILRFFVPFFFVFLSFFLVVFFNSFPLHNINLLLTISCKIFMQIFIYVRALISSFVSPHALTSHSSNVLFFYISQFPSKSDTYMQHKRKFFSSPSIHTIGSNRENGSSRNIENEIDFLFLLFFHVDFGFFFHMLL